MKFNKMNSVIQSGHSYKMWPFLLTHPLDPSAQTQPSPCLPESQECGAPGSSSSSSSGSADKGVAGGVAIGKQVARKVRPSEGSLGVELHPTACI